MNKLKISPRMPMRLLCAALLLASAAAHAAAVPEQASYLLGHCTEGAPDSEQI